MITPLAEFLDTARRGQGLTYQALARAMVLNPSSISRILAGKQLPKAPTLRRFARVLRLEPARLLDLAEQSRPPTMERRSQ